jgi:hypothetical protein
MAQFISVPSSGKVSITINADRITYIREAHGTAVVRSCEVYFDAGRSVTIELSAKDLVALCGNS